MAHVESILAIGLKNRDSWIPACAKHILSGCKKWKKRTTKWTPFWKASCLTHRACNKKTIAIATVPLLLQWPWPTAMWKQVLCQGAMRWWTPASPIPNPSLHQKLVKVFGNNRILNPTTAHRSLYLNTFFSRKHELRELSSLLWQCCMFCARVATPAPTLPRVAKNNATRIWLRTACCWSR